MAEQDSEDRKNIQSGTARLSTGQPSAHDFALLKSSHRDTGSTVETDIMRMGPEVFKRCNVANQPSY